MTCYLFSRESDITCPFVIGDENIRSSERIDPDRYRRKSIPMLHVLSIVTMTTT